MSLIELTHFLSAIREGQRFQSVELARVMDGMSTKDRRFAWFWILHTLFSSTDASRSIQSLELRMDDLREQIIETVRLYMEARNPVALLCHPRWQLIDAYDAESSPPKRVALEKGVTVFLSTSKTRRAESMPLVAAGWFDVIQENGDVVDVIVPAYGQCRVSKDDVTKWDVLPYVEPSTALHRHGIRSLKLVIEDTMFGGLLGADSSAPSVQSLLKLVGRPLESLDVQIKLSRSDKFLDRVWRACPNLKTMQIGPTRLPSLQYVIDAYETNTCSVPSLSLRQCTVGDGGSRMRLIEALEGTVPATKIASKLQEFSFSENPEGDAFLSLDELCVIAITLSTNQSLRYLALGIVANEMECYIDPMFEPLDGQVLNALSNRCKCALLSVVDQANKPALSAFVHAAPALAQLDSSILLQIFRFAAHPIKRSVALKYDFRHG